jgi:hypothetical protein
MARADGRDDHATVPRRTLGPRRRGCHDPLADRDRGAGTIAELGAPGQRHVRGGRPAIRGAALPAHRGRGGRRGPATPGRRHRGPRSTPGRAQGGPSRQCHRDVGCLAGRAPAAGRARECRHRQSVWSPGTEHDGPTASTRRRGPADRPRRRPPGEHGRPGPAHRDERRATGRTGPWTSTRRGRTSACGRWTDRERGAGRGSRRHEHPHDRGRIDHSHRLPGMEPMAVRDPLARRGARDAARTTATPSSARRPPTSRPRSPRAATDRRTPPAGR